VEPFKLKFRVIPPSYEVHSSTIQYRVGDQTIGAPANVSLPDGRGALTVPFAFRFPAHPTTGEIARPRLVINEGTPEELVSGPKQWNLSSFEVMLAGYDPNDLGTDDPVPLVAGSLATRTGDAIASNEELGERYDRTTPGSPATPVQIRWQKQGGVGVYPEAQESTEGIFEALLEGDPKAGTTHGVVASVGEVILGRSDLLPMLAGPAHTIQIVPPWGEATRLVPADGTTLVPLSIKVFDADENPVRDETAVLCKVEGYGTILEEESLLTTNGLARCTYRAGLKTNVDRVIVEVDGRQEEWEVTTFPLQPILQATPPAALVGQPVSLDLVVGDSADEWPVDGTPVRWIARGAQGSADTTLRGGKATANLRFPTPGQHTVVAQVGTASAPTTIEVSPGGGLRISQDAFLLAGDLTADALVSLPSPADSTKQVAVRATAQLTISGGVPGQTVRVALGTFDAPNQEPEARYLMNSLDGEVVPDLYGRHPGTAEGVTVETEPDTGVLGYAFSGTSRITIPATDNLSQTAGLQIVAMIAPRAGGGTVAHRDESFALETVASDGGFRLRLRGMVSGEERSLETQTPLPLGESVVVYAAFDGGMSLQVGEDHLSDPLALVDAGTGDLVFGEGYVGLMGELQIFHTSGRSPLLMLGTPGGGAEQSEAVFDASGTAYFTVSSTGSMTGGGSIFDDREDLRSQAAVRGGLVKLRAWVQEGESSEAALWTFTKDMVAALSYMAEGLLLGSTESSDVPVAFAELYWSIVPLGITQGYMTARDTVLGLEALVEGSATGSDMVNLALVVVTTIFAGTLVKRIRAAGKAAKAGRALKVIAGRQEAFLHLTKWLVKASHDGNEARRLEKTLELLTEHGDEVASMLLDVLKHTQDSMRDLERLEQTLKKAGNAAPDILRELAKLVDEPSTLRRTLDVTRTADKVTPKVVSAGKKIARAINKAIEAKPGGKIADAARMDNLPRNFRGETTKILEDLDDIVDDATEGLADLVTGLTTKVPSRPGTPDGALGVVTYAKSRGLKATAFEKVVDVPVPQGKRLKPYKRKYDLVFTDAAGSTFQVEVKSWTYLRDPKDWGYELRRDIVNHWQTGFRNLRWAINGQAVGGIPPNPQKVAELRKLMLREFDRRLVKARIPRAELDATRLAFERALNGTLLDFF
jgi:hypothetical protein